MFLLGNSLEARVLQPSGKIGGTVASFKAQVHFIHPRQLSLFLERLELPYPNGEVQPGYEEDVSFIQDRVKADPSVTSERHVVVSPKRLSIYNWNPGPRRGKEGAIEKQIAGKCHIITLQEAIEYVDHELLTNMFHAIHCGGCAVLFHKDTFFPHVKATSIHLHDTRRELLDKLMEGDQGWVSQGVLSRVSFRRHPLTGQKHSHTVLLSHISNIHAKKRGIGKKLILTIRAVMLDEHVDLVSGDFNRAA